MPSPGVKINVRARLMARHPEHSGMDFFPPAIDLLIQSGTITLLNEVCLLVGAGRARAKMVFEIMVCAQISELISNLTGPV